ncbi:hypothetical protein [Streptomyces fagopyri]|uniref:hypothetical protein n=1 Tax=Streptomyces fagopyri TaxID=2662397 RepID=UPI0034076F38
MTVVREVTEMVRAEHRAASIATNEGLYREPKHLHCHVRHRDVNEMKILAAYGHHGG